MGSATTAGGPQTTPSHTADKDTPRLDLYPAEVITMKHPANAAEAGIDMQYRLPAMGPGITQDTVMVADKQK